MLGGRASRAATGQAAFSAAWLCRRRPRPWPQGGGSVPGVTSRALWKRCTKATRASGRLRTLARRARAVPVGKAGYGPRGPVRARRAPPRPDRAQAGSGQRAPEASSSASRVRRLVRPSPAAGSGEVHPGCYDLASQAVLLGGCELEKPSRAAAALTASPRARERGRWR